MPRVVIRISYLRDEIFHKLVFRIPIYRVLERVEQVEHARCNDSLFHGVSLSVWYALFEIVVCISFVLEWTLDETRKLSVVTVVENGKLHATVS